MDSLASGASLGFLYSSFSLHIKGLMDLCACMCASVCVCARARMHTDIYRAHKHTCVHVPQHTQISFSAPCNHLFRLACISFSSAQPHLIVCFLSVTLFSMLIVPVHSYAQPPSACCLCLLPLLLPGSHSVPRARTAADTLECLKATKQVANLLSLKNTSQCLVREGHRL